MSANTCKAAAATVGQAMANELHSVQLLMYAIGQDLGITSLMRPWQSNFAQIIDGQGRCWTGGNANCPLYLTHQPLARFQSLPLNASDLPESSQNAAAEMLLGSEDAESAASGISSGGPSFQPSVAITSAACSARQLLKRLSTCAAKAASGWPAASPSPQFASPMLTKVRAVAPLARAVAVLFVMVRLLHPHC